MKSDKMENIKFYFLSYDFILSLIIFIASMLILPVWLDIDKFLLPIYNSLLTITGIITAGIFTVFSVVFATSTDDFILFLEEENIFSVMIDSFKLILKIITFTLIFNILLLVFTYYSSIDFTLQHKILLCLLITLFSYSILSTYSAINSLFECFKRKIEYIKISNKKNDREE